MLSVNISGKQTVPGLCGSSEITLPAKASDTAKTRIMLLDAQYAPLLSAYEL